MISIYFLLTKGTRTCKETKWEKIYIGKISTDIFLGLYAAWLYDNMFYC